jgi:putative flippase GtrA
MSGELALRKLRRPSEKPGDRQNFDAHANPYSSALLRWGKFNLVGAIGIGVQFGALFFLKSAFHLHYLVATAIAVETAVVHNFIWHERFTWADRVVAQSINKQGEPIRTARRVGSVGLSPAVVRRLFRFHLANGAVSILGNLAIMKVLVGLEHMNYLLANLIAIAICSLANFVLSDQWVFEN